MPPISLTSSAARVLKQESPAVSRRTDGGGPTLVAGGMVGRGEPAGDADEEGVEFGRRQAQLGRGGLELLAGEGRRGDWAMIKRSKGSLWWNGSSRRTSRWSGAMSRSPMALPSTCSLTSSVKDTVSSSFPRLLLMDISHRLATLSRRSLSGDSISWRA